MAKLIRKRFFLRGTTVKKKLQRIIIMFNILGTYLKSNYYFNTVIHSTIIIFNLIFLISVYKFQVISSRLLT